MGRIFFDAEYFENYEGKKSEQEKLSRLPLISTLQEPHFGTCRLLKKIEESYWTGQVA
jgi:hypothetical protein